MKQNITAFGAAPVTLNELVRAILQMRGLFGATPLSGVVQPMKRVEFRRVKPQLKIELRRVLEALGEKHRMRTMYTKKASTKEPKLKEFLYDLVWMNKAGMMTLAVECESGNTKDVIYDFKKLFHAKAPMKVMVFSDSNNLANIFPEIEKALNCYGGNISGEQYVAVQV